MTSRTLLCSPTLLLASSIAGSLLMIATVSSCAHDAPVARTAAVEAARTASSPPPAPPPLVLVPADVARTGLIGTFVIPSLERSLASGVSLVRQAAPLPLDAAGVRDMLLSQAGLPPDIAKHLDTGAPIAGAAVVNGSKPTALSAFSFATRSPGDATALLGALGRTIARRGEAVQIENAAGDHGWFLPRGTLVVFADTDEALVRAGNLAIEARLSPKDGVRLKDDVSLRLYPEMAARAAGFALDAGLEQVRQMVEDRVAAGGSKMGPEGARQMRTLLDYAGGVAVAELGLDLDPARGATVLTRLIPKPGSKLEALAHETATNPVDPALVRAASKSDDTGILLTSAYGGATLEQLSRLRARLPQNAGGAIATMGRLYDALVDGLSGRFSLLVRVQPVLSSEMILPMRDAARSARVRTALLATTKEGLMAMFVAATQGEGLDMKKVKVLKVARENVGKTKAIHATMGYSLPPKTEPAIAKLLGPRTMDLFAAVVEGDRLVVATGQGAKARFAAIVAAGAGGSGGNGDHATSSGGPAAAGSVMSDAIASAGARSLFYLLDLRQVAFVFAATGADPRSRMLLGAMHAPLPVLGGTTGDGSGRALTLDLTFPPSCFAGIGGVVQAAMMMSR